MKKNYRRILRHKHRVESIIPFIVVAVFLLLGKVAGSVMADSSVRSSFGFFQISPLPTPTFTPSPAGPTPTPTDTPVPPTPTDTPVPPTPTDTPVPPTPTPSDTPPPLTAWICQQHIFVTEDKLDTTPIIGKSTKGARTVLEIELSLASKRLGSDRFSHAIFWLDKFISRVSKQASNGQIEPADAGLLIDEANEAKLCIEGL